MDGGDGCATGRAEVADRSRHDLARRTGAAFGDEALRTECGEERLLTGERGVDELAATEDRRLHGDRVTVDGDGRRVGEHRAVELDRQAAHHVAALVALREHDQVGSVAPVDHGLHRGGDGDARQGAGEIARGVDLGGAVVGERGGDGGTVTGDERRHVAAPGCGPW